MNHFAIKCCMGYYASGKSLPTDNVSQKKQDMKLKESKRNQ